MERKSLRHALTALIAIALAAAACEKVVLPDYEEEPSPASHDDGTELTLSVYQLEQTAFEPLTRNDSTGHCTRLNFAIYDMEGTRQKQINQDAADDDFGTATFRLAEGSYRLVVLAHSSDGNPAMAHPEKIQFSNATGYSDTFLYYDTIALGTEAQQQSLTLRRIVALCRLVVSDSIPEGVARLEFTYRGGSGHLNAATGLGVTNSTQVVSYDVEAGRQQSQYDLYTFLHETTDSLHLKAVAYDADDSALHERTFDIPMEQNKVTWLTGDFFSTPPSAESPTGSISITINSSWDGELHLTY